ncbi:MAG: SprT-like domain-containing protein [Crocinitomicaceae bacterium]|nr:SprT-like domain-containing protein [Crocinitomicaceae bacterium]
MHHSTDLENALRRFVPTGSLVRVCEILRRYPHHLVITMPRATKLGDFTADNRGQRHQLTVNGNLNQYAFLITLMHEMAHLITYINHKDNVKPHGEEWKENFKKTLGPFLSDGIFPADIENAVRKYLSNPGAATCSDIHLAKTLARYDRTSHPNIKLLDDIPAKSRFVYGKEKRVFIKGDRIRTRYRCVEENTRHEYLFSPLVKIWHMG